MNIQHLICGRNHVGNPVHQSLLTCI